ncbi:hypothetical protein B0H12DRAFT_1029469, partial [Mycena haematopus]
QLSLTFSAGMFCCMALNLPLVLAFNCNGQRMEKYYVLCTAMVCLICNVVPYASGHLGQVFSIHSNPLNSIISCRWDAVNDTCWYRAPDPAVRLNWLIGTQTVWMMISAVGEVGAFITILGYLIAYEARLSSGPDCTSDRC